jgi:hypothetical protein
MAYTSRVTKNTALTQAELDNNFLCHYPIGSLYMNALNNNSPGDIIGYGEWSLFAQGYTLLSANSPRLRHEQPDGWNNTPREYAESLPRTSKSSTLEGSIENGANQTDGYYSPGFAGGEPTVKVNEFPKHSHYLQDSVTKGGSFVNGQYRGRTDYDGFYVGPHYRGQGNNPMSAAKIGGGTQTFQSNVQSSLGHNNIQKYITVNIWKRDS